MKKTAAKTLVVYLAAREVPRRFMGTRVEPKCEAELRELVSGTYVVRARVTRPTKAAAIEAARALAARRGWTVEDRRVSWTTSSEAAERAIDEDVRDLRDHQDDTVGPYVAAAGYAWGKPYKLPGTRATPATKVDRASRVSLEVRAWIDQTIARCREQEAAHCDVEDPAGERSYERAWAIRTTLEELLRRLDDARGGSTTLETLFDET